MSNVYYVPDNLGLTVVAEIEYSDQSYCFDTRVVWKDTSGKLYTARDSGCSCPTPFEDYTTLESIDTFNMDELRSEVDAELKSSYRNINGVQAKDFISAVEAALSSNAHA